MIVIVVMVVVVVVVVVVLFLCVLLDATSWHGVLPVCCVCACADDRGVVPCAVFAVCRVCCGRECTTCGVRAVGVLCT